MLNCIKDSNLILSRVIGLFSAGILFLLTSAINADNFIQLPVIEEVIVQTEDGLGGEDFNDLITIKPGARFSYIRISDNIKQLYKTGLFSDVKVLKAGEDKIKLIFLLTKNLIVRDIKFSGLEFITERKVRSGLETLRKGESFSEEKLQRALGELAKALEEEGFFHADIGVERNKYPETGQIDVTFRLEYIRKYIVGNIGFKGDVILTEEQLLSKMDIKEGSEFVPSVLNKDLHRLRETYAKMDYSRAEVSVDSREFDRTRGSVNLIIKISSGEKIEIDVKGADIPKELLLPIWEGEIFEEWGLAEGEAKIISYLRKKGYLFATVASRIEQDMGRIRVIHVVSPGEKYKIMEIEFRGLSYFSAGKLEDELMLEGNIPFFNRISGDRLFELPLEIVYLYKTYGFPDTRVVVNYERYGKKVKPIFYIEEGPQQTIEKILFAGARLYEREDLLSQISSTEGGPFYLPSVQKDVERLESFYLNKGIRNSELRAEIKNPSGGKHQVVFHIREGKVVTIDNIIIAGNKVTRKNTILRELMIDNGDLAYYDEILASKRRLENLGIFTEVNIEEIPLSPDRENLLITVREGERNYAGLGLGIETKNEPRSFEIWNNEFRPRGTAEYIRSNLFGTAAQISIVGQLSLIERRAVLSWEQPYFFGLHVQTYLNAWLEREERLSYSYERRGISLSTIKPLTESGDMTLLTALRVVRTTLVDLEVSESEVDRQFFPFSATSLSGSFIWDRRDDPFNPHNGHFFSSVLEWAYPIFNDESNFQKSFSKFQYIFSPISNLQLISTIRLGLGRGRMPIHERFFGGGSNSFRGVLFDELGPKDADSGKPIGGKALLLFNFDITFPLLSSLENLRGAVFFDHGNVFGKRSQVSWSGLHNALGFGLRYKTPLGPIRLELGWNLDPELGEKNPLVFITLGNVF
ncbi:MAG: BamA/TamA family outer membrane protein [Candidatus Aminicenantes bacterium]|nr:BamA/TamA family outer membrane protein [Candidatus Aminicenantes bacterium]